MEFKFCRKYLFASCSIEQGPPARELIVPKATALNFLKY